MPITDAECVILNSEQWAAVKAVLDRLYKSENLDGDQRRDLANFLEANISRVFVCRVDELSIDSQA
jgi:hypothetical protein